MKLSTLTLPQRIAAGLGCVSVLALAAAALLYGGFEYLAGQRTREQLDVAPHGWTEALRAWGRPPSLAGLALTRTDSGDGAVAAHDPAWGWSRPGIEQAYRALAGGGAGATSVDSAVWRDVASDTTLDRFVRAARRRDWRATDRILAGADSVVHRNILAMPLPNYGSIRDAGRGLVVRGLLRLQRGDREGARTDFGAAVSLGEQLFRREPTLVGALIGKALIGSGTRGWDRYAAAVRDTAIARSARAASAWAGVRLETAELLLVAPDTALSLARDTGLALGLRAQALTSSVMAALVRPRGFIFGVPSRHERQLRELAAGTDPDVARLAAIAAITASRTGLPRPGALMRELSGPRP